MGREETHTGFQELSTDVDRGFAGLSFELRELQGGQKQLQTEMQGVNSRIDSLRTDFQGMQAEMQGVNSRIEALRTDFQGVQAEMQQTQFLVVQLLQAQEIGPPYLSYLL